MTKFEVETSSEEAALRDEAFGAACQLRAAEDHDLVADWDVVAADGL